MTITAVGGDNGCGGNGGAIGGDDTGSGGGNTSNCGSMAVAQITKEILFSQVYTQIVLFTVRPAIHVCSLDRYFGRVL